MKGVDPSQIKLADSSGLGYADDTTIDIYNQKYQPEDMTEDRLKKIVKELMADLPPTEKVSAMPGQDIKDQMISAVGKTNDPQVLTQLSITFGGAGFKSSDNLGEMKRKLVPFMSKAGASEYLKLAQKFAVENGEIVMKSVKQDVAFIKENKMKLSTLKQIIREEIQRVVEGSDGETLYLDSGNGLTKTAYPQLVAKLDKLLGSKEETSISFPEFISLVKQAGPVDLTGTKYISNWGDKSQSWFNEWLTKNKGLEVAVKRQWGGISISTQVARDASAAMQSSIDALRKDTSSGLD